MEFLLYKEKYDNLKNRYEQICEYLKISKIEDEITLLKEKTLNQSFWSNKSEASDILKQISKLESNINFYKSVSIKYEDLCLYLGQYQ